MNWILILVLVVLAISIIEGYRKGLLRIIYSLVSWIIVFVFVSWATPYIMHFLIENTTIYEQIEMHCEETVRQSAQEQTGIALDEKNKELSNLGVKLPENVMDNILDKATGAADEFLEESGVYTEIARGLADFLIEGISFLIALVLAGILVNIIAQLLGIVSHIPVLKGINRFLGVFAGGIYGFILVWIAFYVIALCSTSESGRVLVSYIYENPFLTFLYENNLVLTLILKHF